MQHHPDQAPAGFEATGLEPAIVTALNRAGLTNPTPIQAAAIPIAITGADLIGIAQTGTGKTMGFGLPIINRLRANPTEKALIIVPTRELALQVEESLRTVTSYLQPHMRAVSLIGGAPMHLQIQRLRANPRIIVATPGRLADHLQQRTVHLRDVKILVLDEADRMLDMGFAPQIDAICAAIPADRQTLMFSATLDPVIERLANGLLKSPQKVEIASQGTSTDLVAQEICYVETDAKHDVLLELLKVETGPVLVFARTKHGTAKLAQRLRNAGFTAAEIHADRSLGQRRMALEGFKQGRHQVLVATDVASRGIDVKDIHLVINYDLPDASEDYVHRIGRTGRAGSTGRAVSLARVDEYKSVRAIEKLINKPLPLSPHSAPEPKVVASPYGGGGRRSFGGGRRSGGPSRGGFRRR
jgi:ATP-dependent RNA helicase RhlE